MKKLVLVAAIAATTFGAVSTAQATEVSANAALTTDYKFRGISQTNSGPAFQGGFDVDFGNGFYVGNWNSNVGFGGGAGIEMDFYGGYAGETSGVSYDVGLLQYYYEGAPNVSPDPDTLEVYGNLGYAGFTLGLSYSLGKDYFDINQAGVGTAPLGTASDLGGSTYIKLGYEYSLSENITLAASYGMTSFSEDVATNPASVRIDGYTDYSVGATYTAGKFDITAAIVGADNDAEIFFGKDSTEPSLILTVGTSF